MTMTTLALFLFAFCLTQVVWSKAQLDLENAEHYFEVFIQENNRHYANETEKQIRFEIFKANLEIAIKMNEDSEHATFGITQFMDLNIEEYMNLRSGLIRQEDHIGRTGHCLYSTVESIPDVDAPESFDWRDYNAVTPPREQGDCGSCYAFSAVGNIEGQYAIKYKKLIELSKQQIVDCEDTAGCNGGYTANTLGWLRDNGGLQAEADYPYASLDGFENKCIFDQSKVKVKIAYCFAYKIASAEKLKQLLFQTGPLSVHLIPFSLRNYKDGVLTDEHCSKDYPIQHAVLLVGYGTDEKNMPYWTFKDSSGEHFGENGFFRLQRGEGVNTCGMFSDFIVTSTIE